MEKSLESKIIRSISSFLQLTDTPSTFSGQGSKVVSVKATEDGLEFVVGGGGSVEITNGSYAGDNTEDRAIAHGLSGAPIIILLTNHQNMFYRLITATSRIISVSNSYVVQTPDATNFYVGDEVSYNHSANLGGHTYYWQAIKE